MFTVIIFEIILNPYHPQKTLPYSENGTLPSEDRLLFVNGGGVSERIGDEVFLHVLAGPF